MNLPSHSFAARYELIREVFDDLLEPCLLEKRDIGMGTPRERASVEWLFAQRSDRHYILEIVVRHGAFADVERRLSRKWTQLDWITWSEVENALLAALTFSGSPYQREGQRWGKRMECMA